MQIEITFTAEPIPAALPPLEESNGRYGSFVEFRGIVRGEEHGEAIAGLRYEIYEAMAEKQLRSIIEELAAPHPCHTLRLIHRMGDILVGEAAIYIGITSRHREEGYSMLSALMLRLKKDVPIWKVAAI